MKKITLLLIVLLTIATYSQTGPGGIGDNNGTSNLVMWLDANTISATNGTTVTNWTDLSGNNFDFSDGNGAVFNNSNINNYSSFSFNGSSNYFEKSFENSLNPNEYTIFAIDNVTSSNEYKAVFSNRDDPPGNDRSGFILYSRPSNNNWQFWTGVTSDWKITTNNTSTANNWAFQMINYDSTSNDKNLFINGNLDANNNHDMITNLVRPFRIGSGANEGSPNYYFKGDISEIIMFNRVINETERIIINNYISSKYDITLVSNDFYTQDNSGNGDFDHNVAGIGQETSTDNHIDSQGTGIIRINTPSALSDGDYLFWGEETKDPTYDFSSSTEYTERLNSKWRVSKQNDLGTISLSVKETDIDLSGMESCAGVKLIVSNSSDFTTKTTYSMVLSGGTYTASNVNFSDGDYFTFEYFDTIVVDGTKFYNGSGASNVPSTTDQCYKLLVKSTADGTLALTENAHVKEIEVENGGKLVVNTGLELKVNNGIILDGDIRLIGNSQLIQTHTGTSQVTGNGKLYLDKQSNLSNVYQSGYWSSPVTTSGNTFTIEDAMKDGTTPTSATSIPSNLNFTTGYDGNASTKTISSYWLANLTNALDWNRHRSQTASHNVTQGYNMKSLGLNFTFVGKPNDGDYTSTVTSGNSSLLGNPYPSAMNADAFLATNNTLFSTLYFWDGSVDNSNTHVRSAYTGGYATYNGTIGVGFNGGIAPNNRISVGQGFFVDATDNGTIIFNNSHRLYDTSANLYARPTQIPVLRIGLDFSINETETFHRQLAVTFINGATNGYEPAYDAIMYDMQPSDFALKVNGQTNDFVITGIENYVDTIEIPLYVKLDQQRNMAFSIDAIEGLTPDNIYLKDTYNNQYYNLNDTVNIYLEEGNFTDRFFIVFRNQVANITDLINNNNVTIIDRTNSIKLKSNLIIKQIQIFNTIGQVIFNKKLNNNQTEIFPSIYKGQFVIIKTKLENGQEITTKLIKK